ncbi:unnamed protein product, partial [Scytosiphon promiscuus]
MFFSGMKLVVFWNAWKMHRGKGQPMQRVGASIKHDCSAAKNQEESQECVWQGIGKQTEAFLELRALYYSSDEGGVGNVDAAEEGSEIALTQEEMAEANQDDEAKEPIAHDGGVRNTRALFWGSITTAREHNQKNSWLGTTKRMGSLELAVPDPGFDAGFDAGGVGNVDAKAEGWERDLSQEEVAEADSDDKDDNEVKDPAAHEDGIIDVPSPRRGSSAPTRASNITTEQPGGGGVEDAMDQRSEVITLDEGPTAIVVPEDLQVSGSHVFEIVRDGDESLPCFVFTRSNNSMVVVDEAKQVTIYTDFFLGNLEMLCRTTTEPEDVLVGNNITTAMHISPPPAGENENTHDFASVQAPAPVVQPMLCGAAPEPEDVLVGNSITTAMHIGPPPVAEHDDGLHNFASDQAAAHLGQPPGAMALVRGMTPMSAITRMTKYPQVPREEELAMKYTLRVGLLAIVVYFIAVVILSSAMYRSRRAEANLRKQLAQKERQYDLHRQGQEQEHQQQLRNQLAQKDEHHQQLRNQLGQKDEQLQQERRLQQQDLQQLREKLARQEEQYGLQREQQLQEHRQEVRDQLAQQRGQYDLQLEHQEQLLQHLREQLVQKQKEREHELRVKQQDLQQLREQLAQLEEQFGLQREHQRQKYEQQV